MSGVSGDYQKAISDVVHLLDSLSGDGDVSISIAYIRKRVRELTPIDDHPATRGAVRVGPMQRIGPPKMG